MKHVQKIGRWDIAGLFTRNLKRDITEEMAVALKQIGLEGEGLMKKYIRDQKGNWQMPSALYLKYKQKKGLSNKTLMATTLMVQSITSVEAYPKVFIGVKRGVKNKEGVEVANIAAVMEFGSEKRNIPARPYMAPVNEIMQEKLDNNLLGKRIVEHLRKKYSMGTK